jgi:hypothetical protein
VILEEKIFQWPHPIFWLSPLGQKPGPSFGQFLIFFTQGWFVLSLIEIGLLVLEKNFFFQYRYSFPYCGPSQTLGTMIWKKMSESFHVNMSSSGSEVFEKKIFKWANLMFAILWLSFLWSSLNNFVFPLRKDNLYQVWLKLACWF